MSLYSSGHGEADDSRQKKSQQTDRQSEIYMYKEHCELKCSTSKWKEWDDDDDDDGNENDDDAVKGAVSFHRARQTTYLQHVW